MFGKKKKTHGFQTKPRTRQELEEDYGQHAFQIGHKTRLLKTKEQIYSAEETRLLSEIDQHALEMAAILKEMSAHPAKDPALSTPTSTLSTVKQ